MWRYFCRIGAAEGPVGCLPVWEVERCYLLKGPENGDCEPIICGFLENIVCQMPEGIQPYFSLPFALGNPRKCEAE